MGYAPNLARWLSPDPLALENADLLDASPGPFYNGRSAYEYANNSPTRFTDPSGLLCTVCASGIRYNVAIADLDAFSKTKIYSKLANSTRLIVGLNASKNGKFVLPVFVKTGIHTVLNDKKDLMLGLFLFFVDWDICETKKGDCRLFLDETGSRLTYDDGEVYGKIMPDGDIRDRADVRDDDRTPPLNQCTKILVFVDAPFGIAEKNKNGFVQHIKQKLEVKDRDSGATVSSITHEVKFSVSKKFVISQ